MTRKYIHLPGRRTASPYAAKKKRKGKGGNAQGRGKQRAFHDYTRDEPPAAVATAESPDGPPAPGSEIELPPHITVRELGDLIGRSPIDVIKALMNLGVMAHINQTLDYDTAAIVLEEMGYKVREEKPAVLEEEAKEEEEEAPVKTLRQRILEVEDEGKLQPRPPVVAVLGHVDHGKTTLLDAIRETNVVAREAGGITQHIGAYQVTLPDGRRITFLDTPGHEAFTSLRARGAQVTDVAILVVAADDGVMPQTIEAINHIRAAQVPMVVAINKIDKPGANPERVKSQLAELGIVVEDYGGDIMAVPISAKQRIGIEDLLEAVLLVAEDIGVRANPEGQCVGTVIESKLDRFRGPMATLLVQNGTLRVGDVIVIDEMWGRVRAMFDDQGRPIQEAPPATPVQILGLPEVPPAGSIFQVVANEQIARAITEERAEAKRREEEQRQRLTLEQMFAKIQKGEIKTLNLIVKTDVQGSLEAIISSLNKLNEQVEEVELEILHQGVGNVNESDVMLAATSHAVVLGFNVKVDAAAERLAEQEGVDIRLYNVIYTLLEDVEKAMRGLLEPERREVVLGQAEVRAIFRVRQGRVAGCYVLSGVIRRNARARLRRGDKVIYEGRLASLRRYQEDVTEVRQGYECGIRLDGFDDFQEGDIIEAYQVEEG